MLGPIGSSPGGVIGQWRWSRKVEAVQGRVVAVVLAAGPHPELACRGRWVTVEFAPDGFLASWTMATATGSTSKMEGMVSKRSRRGTSLSREGEGRAIAVTAIFTDCRMDSVMMASSSCHEGARDVVYYL
jgi:hypothetical protein